MDFKTKVLKIGPLVEEMINEGDLLIVFGENAPDTLAEVAVIHTDCQLSRPVAPGDQVTVCDKTYTVTAVGEEANKTLAELGHCTLKFSGHPEVELPGQIEMKGDGFPNLTIGGEFNILFQ